MAGKRQILPRKSSSSSNAPPGHSIEAGERRVGRCHALEDLEIPLHVTDEAKLANVLLPLRADVARDDLAISVLKT